MSKTIEEAAKEYNDKHIDETINGLHDDFLSWEPLQDGIINAFKAGANHVYKLPLSDRMTAEEKERVNKAYAYAITHIEFDENHAEVRLLHRIFGADFFKEEE